MLCGDLGGVSVTGISRKFAGGAQVETFLLSKRKSVKLAALKSLAKMLIFWLLRGCDVSV